MTITPSSDGRRAPVPMLCTGLAPNIADRSGDIDVFVVRPDGGDVTRLTDAEGSEQTPLWVPRQRVE